MLTAELILPQKMFEKLKNFRKNHILRGGVKFCIIIIQLYITFTQPLQ